MPFGPFPGYHCWRWSKCPMLRSAHRSVHWRSECPQAIQNLWLLPRIICQWENQQDKTNQILDKKQSHTTFCPILWNSSSASSASPIERKKLSSQHCLWPRKVHLHVKVQIWWELFENLNIMHQLITVTLCTNIGINFLFLLIVPSIRSHATCRSRPSQRNGLRVQMCSARSPSAKAALEFAFRAISGRRWSEGPNVRKHWFVWLEPLINQYIEETTLCEEKCSIWAKESKFYRWTL